MAWLGLFLMFMGALIVTPILILGLACFLIFAFGCKLIFIGYHLGDTHNDRIH